MNPEWSDLAPDEFLRRWYVEEYGRNAYGDGARLMQRWMHRSLERDLGADTRFDRVLEVGANVAEHLPYVRHPFSSYLMTDLQDQLPDHVRARLAAVGASFEVADVQSLPYSSSSFDRVVMTCVLHHVSDPERALSELRRVARHGAQLDLFLSSDPGMAFRFARWAGPYRDARRRGLGDVKQLVDARDHRNHVGALRRLVGHVFRDDFVTERTYPLPRLSWNSSFWHTYRIVLS